jgi:hypothetical protein
MATKFVKSKAKKLAAEFAQKIEKGLNTSPQKGASTTVFYSITCFSVFPEYFLVTGWIHQLTSPSKSNI